LAALYLRNANIWWPDLQTVALFFFASVAFSVGSLALFRVSDAIPRYFSMTDAVNLIKSIIAAELCTALAIFTFTRLDGIPRSLPAIHALVMIAGLLAVRGVQYLIARRAGPDHRTEKVPTEHLILIGVNDFSSLYIKQLHAQTKVRRRVIAVLGLSEKWVGRSIGGVRVYGPASHLGALIEEFAAHGVMTNRVIVMRTEAQSLNEDFCQDALQICHQMNIEMTFLPFFEDFGGKAAAEKTPSGIPQLVAEAPQDVSGYFRVKSAIEFPVALFLILIGSVFYAPALSLALIDVGWPVLFWQWRIGRGGQEFQLYKVRTLRPSFDRSGNKIPEDERLSPAGRFLRKTHFDELLQLFNVILGDMSLVGPRPLLAHDQPAMPAVRLLVRPGITGWAQVNGGTSLNAEEKEELDAWYVRHASFWLDLKIIFLTVGTLLWGERRNDKALELARRDAAVEAADPRSAPPSGRGKGEPLVPVGDLNSPPAPLT